MRILELIVVMQIFYFRRWKWGKSHSLALKDTKRNISPLASSHFHHFCLYHCYSHGAATFSFQMLVFSAQFQENFIFALESEINILTTEIMPVWCFWFCKPLHLHDPTLFSTMRLSSYAVLVLVMFDSLLQLQLHQALVHGILPGKWIFR